MAGQSGLRILRQEVNGIDFYCELRGNGPTVALIISGEGDCGSFSKVADLLADEFTVFTCDMRGCSRTSSPKEWRPVTAEILASDIAGLIRALDLVPATFYGCSSGGQAVLSLGVNHAEIVRNLMVHEPALMEPASLKVLREMLDQFVQSTGSKNAAVQSFLALLVGDEEAWKGLGQEYHERISKNGEVWMDHYFGNVDQRHYSDEELARMPPLVVSLGEKTPSLPENLRTLPERANADLVWLPCMHYPQVTIPELLADHIRKYAKQYL